MGHGGDMNSNLTLVTYFCVILGRLPESEPQFLPMQWAGGGNGMMHMYIGKASRT